MKFSFFAVFSVLFFTSISCSNSDQTSDLKLKKIEIEKKKLEIEEKKLDNEMEQLSSTNNSNRDQAQQNLGAISDEFNFLNGEWNGFIAQK